MAHALLIISELSRGELLCPFAIIDKHGVQEVLHFEANTQESAVASGKSYLASPEPQVSAIAFARDGRALNRELEYVDVLSVTVREVEQRYECTFSQFYRCQPEGLNY